MRQGNILMNILTVFRFFQRLSMEQEFKDADNGECRHLNDPLGFSLRQGPVPVTGTADDEQGEFARLDPVML